MERPGPEAFRRRFTGLVVASGLSARELGAASDVGHSVISGWQRGDGLPQTADRLIVVVRVCIQAADRRGTALTAAQRSEAEWRALLQSAKEIRDGRIPKASRRPGTADVSRARWQMAGTEARGHCRYDLKITGAGLSWSMFAHGAAATGAGPRVVACLRNLVIGLLGRAGPVNLAAEPRCHARDPRRPLATLGISLG